MNQRRRGFMLFDAIIAMGICSTLMAVIFVMQRSEQRASAQLADVRAATRLAEESLDRLRQRQGMPISTPPDRVTVEALEQGQSIAGFMWVRVRATHNGRTVELVGLARNNKLGNS